MTRVDLLGPEVIASGLHDVADVRAWMRALLDAGVSFHPEETLTDIVDSDRMPTWPVGVAEYLDGLMSQAYRILGPRGIDPCGLACEVMAEYLAEREAVAP